MELVRTRGPHHLSSPPTVGALGALQMHAHLCWKSIASYASGLFLVTDQGWALRFLRNPPEVKETAYAPN